MCSPSFVFLKRIIKKAYIVIKEELIMTYYSISPAGEKFPIPEEDKYATEFTRIASLVEQARIEGKEIVVVMGVGFVGAVMAAIIADTVDKESGKPGKFVIGCQRPSTRSYWKIPLLNRGISPVKAEDPEVDPMIARCVLEKKTQENQYWYCYTKNLIPNHCYPPLAE